MSIFVHFHSLLDYFNVSLILELNPEFRDFKLWDQKLQFKGFVSEILVEYPRDFVTLANDFLPASSDSYTHNFSLGLTNFYISESLSSQNSWSLSSQKQ